jgi:hypothetical protein
MPVAILQLCSRQSHCASVMFTSGGQTREESVVGSPI